MRAGRDAGSLDPASVTFHCSLGCSEICRHPGIFQTSWQKTLDIGKSVSLTQADSQ